jgi:hypothetical protein
LVNTYLVPVGRAAKGIGKSVLPCSKKAAPVHVKDRENLLPLTNGEGHRATVVLQVAGFAAGSMEGLMAVRCKLGLALVASGAIGMALLGCSETMSLVDLPNISRLPEKLLSKEEQAKTMNQMLEKGQTHQSDAIKEIEAAKEPEKAK